MQALLVVIAISGVITFNSDLAPDSCAMLAKEMRMDSHISTAYCEVWDEGGNPSIRRN